MAKIVKSLSLDVALQNRIQAVLAKQYDKDSRFLKIRMLNEGEPITVEQTSIVTINASRADKESKAFAGEVNEDGTVTVPITYWMLELDDKVSCDISVTDALGRKLSTLNFTIDVEHANYTGDDISTDDNYDVLTQLIAEVSELKSQQASWTADQIDLLETILSHLAYDDETSGQTAADKLIASLRREEAPVTHTVTFVADGVTVSAVTYTEGDTSVTEPDVPPKDHYTGAWEEYTLGTADITVEAVYTPITYTITFVDDGGNHAVTYTVLTASEVTAPTVTPRDGYTASWPSWQVGYDDTQTVTAVYTLATATLTGITAAYSGGSVAAGTTLDQLTGITVTATYSDGSTATVTDSTLSGTLTAGQDNTVTVEYQGQTAIFSVTVYEAESTSYTVTYNLTNCSSSNTATSVESGESFVATIMANTGYDLGTVTVTMGGGDITSTAVSGGSINIAAVSGDIVITATATENAATDDITQSGSVLTINALANTPTQSGSVLSIT